MSRSPASSSAALVVALWVAVASVAAQTATPADAPEEKQDFLDKKRLMDEAWRRWKEWEPYFDKASKKVKTEYDKYNKWEYRAIAVGASDARTLLVKLNALGEDGWECFCVVQLVDGQHLLLRRRPESVINALPMRELLRLLLFQLVSADGAGQ